MGWGGMPMGQRSADAHFIVMMIPHHEGAIAMADLAVKRSQRPEIHARAGLGHGSGNGRRRGYGLGEARHWHQL